MKSSTQHSETQMELFHGSHDAIKEIKDSGVFGGIFGASDKNSALSHGPVLHRIVSPRPLTNYALNYEIESAWDAAVEVAGGNEEIAESILSASCPTLDSCDTEDAGEQGWELQRLRGALATKLGYTSVEMKDEHGTTWLCLAGCAIDVI